MEEKKKMKQQQSVRTDYWLQPNIVVKVITKRLGEKYHKKKAVIMVRMLHVVFSLSSFLIFLQSQQTLHIKLFLFVVSVIIQIMRVCY